MAATQEQVTALNQALTQSQDHTAQLSQQIDQIKADSITALKLAEANKKELVDVIDRLRQEAVNSANELQTRVQAMENVRGGRSQGLIDAKTFDPKIFSGKDDENIKNWAKRVRAYCNARKRGFRTILEWAEQQNTPIDDADLTSLQWEPALESDGEFYEYLSMVTTDEALLLVEKFKNHGFEAWRQLHRRFNPTGGRFEVSRMNNLLSRKQCKTLVEVPAAVDVLERDFANYEARSQHAFPAEWKIPLLLQLLPDKAREELEFKFSMGEKDYGKMVTNIVSYTNEHRVSKQRAKNPNDMDVDSVTSGEYSQADWQKYLEDLENYYEAEISYMGKSGKGGKGGKRGKGGYFGKGGKGGKGKGDGGKSDQGSPAASGQVETRKCHWCKKPGHLKRDCRRFLSGKPKTPEDHDARSLDQPDWEVDDEEASQLDEDLDPMDEDSDTDSDDDFENADEEFTPESADPTNTEEEFTPEPVDPTKAHVGAGRAVRTPPVRSSSSWKSPPEARSGESLSEKILREQREVNRRIFEATPPPPGLLAKDTLKAESEANRDKNEVKMILPQLRLCGGIVSGSGDGESEPMAAMEYEIIEDPQPDETEIEYKVVAKNRNKSAKRKLRKKLITVLDEVDEKTREFKEMGTQSKPQTSEMEVQTEISLRSTQFDVIWTASSLEAVVDAPEKETGGVTDDEEVIDDEASTAHVDVGERADMLDSIEQEFQDSNCVDFLMNLYFYVLPAIMIMMYASVHEGCDDISIDMIQEDNGVKKQKASESSKDPQRRRIRLRKGITVDSGAHSNVMPKRMIRDKRRIRPSAGSKRGAHYVAANNGRIPNEGETEFKFKTAEGQDRCIVFQVAEVNKALGAVSYFVDDNFRVTFGKDMKTGVDMSRMMNKATGEVTRFRRVKNIWVLDAVVDEDDVPPHFHRQA